MASANAQATAGRPRSAARRRQRLRRGGRGQRGAGPGRTGKLRPGRRRLLPPAPGRHGPRRVRRCARSRARGGDARHVPRRQRRAGAQPVGQRRAGRAIPGLPAALEHVSKQLRAPAAGQGAGARGAHGAQGLALRGQERGDARLPRRDPGQGSRCSGAVPARRQDAGGGHEAAQPRLRAHPGDAGPRRCGGVLPGRASPGGWWMACARRAASGRSRTSPAIAWSNASRSASSTAATTSSPRHRPRPAARCWRRSSTCCPATSSRSWTASTAPTCWSNPCAAPTAIARSISATPIS